MNVASVRRLSLPVSRIGIAAWLVGALAFLALSAGPAAVAAEGGMQPFVATGEAAGDPVKARQQAIAAATFAAIDRAVAGLLPAEVVAEHFQKINELVFSRPESFVQNYKVRAEWCDAARCRVLIECAVVVEALKARLAEAGAGSGAAPSTGGHRVLFMIAERAFAQDPPRFWWSPAYRFTPLDCETAMGEILAQNGFPLIDHDASRRSGEVEANADMGAEPPLDEVLRLGALLRADVVVVGQAVAETAAEAVQGRPMAYNGKVTVRAVDVHSGRVIAEIQEQAVAVATEKNTGSRNAIAAAGRQAGQALVQRLSGISKPSSDRKEAVTVFVRGIQPMARFVRFREALSGLPGVASVQVKEMTATEAVLQATYAGTVQDLETALRGQVFDGFRVAISGLGADRIDLELTGGGHLP